MFKIYIRLKTGEKQVFILEGQPDIDKAWCMVARELGNTWRTILIVV